MLKTIRRRLAFALVVSMLLQLFVGVSPVLAEDSSDMIGGPEFVPLLAVTLSSGETTGATSATVTDNVYGNLLVNVTEQEIATPRVGEAAPTAGDNLITDYEPGADITAGVAAGNYLQIYDVDMEEGARIAAFYQAKLTGEDINDEGRTADTELTVALGYAYIDKNSNIKFTRTNTVTKITSDTAILNDGWYIVEGNINRTGTVYSTGSITVNGNVHLILANGSSLTVNGGGEHAGIYVPKDKSLTIYAQSKGNEMGTLNASGNAQGDYGFSAGIGGRYLGSPGIIGERFLSCGDITINGGRITATGGGFAAGIGGGSDGYGGNITINNGIITATGGDYAAGIGGGYKSSGGKVIINGGTVIATGGSNGAGIGGGAEGYYGEIIINDNAASINASGSFGGEDIGNGKFGEGATVIRHGDVKGVDLKDTESEDIPVYTYIDENGEIQNTGTIAVTKLTQDTDTLEAGWYIVEGVINRISTFFESGSITVNGSVHLILADNSILTITGWEAGINVIGENSLTIYAQSKGDGAGTLNVESIDNAAGIGSPFGSPAGKITINGGIITAKGGETAAGIGGGYTNFGGEIIINGGRVTATGGYHAAGIGGGYHSLGEKIIINGGTVTATGGAAGGIIRSRGGGAGIGSGEEGVSGEISINGGIITATGGDYAAGIGGGYQNSGGNIIINNYPTVIATGKNDAADMGDGTNSTGTTIIKRGDVEGVDLTYVRLEVQNLPPDYANKIIFNEGEYGINKGGITGFFTEKSIDDKHICLELYEPLINISPGDVQNSRIILNAHDYAKPVAGFGNALDFPENLPGRIDISSGDVRLSGRSDFTISMWIFPKGTEPYQTLYRQEADVRGSFGLDFRFIKHGDDEGYLYFGFNNQSTSWQNAFPWNDSASLANITKIPVNQWSHVALTKSGKSVKLYANGKKYYEMILDDTHFYVPAPNQTNISIGGTSAVNQFFCGRMDEIQFWNMALTPDEIKAWMYRSIDCSHEKYANLIYYYKLNQSSGTTVMDEKGSCDGTMINLTGDNWVASDVRGWTVDAGSTLEGRLIGSYDAGSSNDGTDWNITFEIVEHAKKGTVTIIGDNQFEYCTHDMKKVGHDSFTYSVKGPNGRYSNTQTVNIDIIPILSAGNGNSFGSPSNSQSTNNANGKTETVATATTTREGDKTVITVVLDDKKVEKRLEQEGNNAVVTIPVMSGADVVIGTLNGHTVKNMENKDAVLEIKTGQVTYTLPASQINIDAVSGQFGKQVELKDITVSVKISEPAADTVKIVEDTADKNNYQIIVKPIEFEITCSSGSKTVAVSRFNAYVERMIAIPEGVDPSKITTGVILNSDGTFSHVPTVITMIDGKYYAKINSLTNSAYSIIYSPKTFQDVGKHWAEKEVNDMASRLVVSGIGDDKFEPDRDITRAEFAAIVVRALGLMSSGTGKDAFIDVMKKNWYYDAVSIAYEYGITSGYENGKFWPDDKITREQAMTMIARAMKITGSKVELADGEADKLLTSFTDAYSAAEYAKANIASCVKAGIVSGRSGKLIAPKDNITRAEVAVIVQRLLQNSNLI
jgi:hypothetical protein